MGSGFFPLRSQPTTTGFKDEEKIQPSYRLRAWCSLCCRFKLERAASSHLSSTECASHSLTGHLTVLYIITCQKPAFLEAGTLVYTSVVLNNHGEKNKDYGGKNLSVKRVKFTQEKGKEHLEITRGVASSILHIFAVALWKPKRFQHCFFIFPLNVKLSAHIKAHVNSS